MGTLTPNYDLLKPATTDVINVETDINASMDTLDTELKRVDDLSTNPPRCRVHQITGSVTALANATWTNITFTGTAHEDYDTAAIHDGASNTDRLTIPSNGYYTMSGKGATATNGTGVRGSRWTKNGTVIPGTTVMLPTTGAGAVSRHPAATTTVPCLATDIIRLQLFQDSGGSLNTFADTDPENATFAEIRKVSA